MPPTKLGHRAARRLHTAWLAKLKQTCPDECLVLDRLDSSQRVLQRARHCFEKARAHGLTLVLPQLRHDLLARVKAVQEAASLAQQRLERAAPTVPSLATWVAELQQVEAEFNSLRIDWKRSALSATTEPVTLEGVDLGAFAIEFFWDRLAGHAEVKCFDVVALDPNPATADERVTHPHVKGTTLCAGDATAPLRKALEQGRLADAFCLIRSVLTHYNPNSPHVSLDDWGGTECADCGHATRDEDQHHCAGCGQDYCDDCATRCAACDDTRCFGCLERCAGCAERCCSGCLRSAAQSCRDCCPRCLRACAVCGAAAARDELTPETELCSVCRRQQPALGDSAVPTAVVDTPAPIPSPLENNHAEPLEPVAVVAV